MTKFLAILSQIPNIQKQHIRSLRKMGAEKYCNNPMFLSLSEYKMGETPHIPIY